MTMRESYAAGTFCWVDLMSPDPERSKKFYGALFGWGHKDMPTDMGPPYTLFEVEGRQAAGMGPQPKEMRAAGVPPVWSSYIWVDDADAVVAKAIQLGAKVTVPVTQVMSAGRMAFLNDPTGATFGVWEPGDNRGARVINEPNAFCWNELYTRDVEAAEAFYAGLFGWTFATDAGGYTMIMNGDDSNGGIMRISPEMGRIPPNWGVYFAVSDLEATRAKVLELGGKHLTAAMTVEEIGSFCALADDQGGAFFAIQLRGRA